MPNPEELQTVISTNTLKDWNDLYEFLSNGQRLPKAAESLKVVLKSVLMDLREEALAKELESALDAAEQLLDKIESMQEPEQDDNV